MKLKALTTLLLLSFATFALASDCDGLYQGKAIKLKNHGAGAFFGASTIPAIVLGVDKSNGMVSIKLTNSGETKEGSCYTLKQEMR